MKLLIVTQKIDHADENLGFFCKWLEELKNNFSEVRVITSYLNEKNKPDGIKIFSLGKERGTGKTKRVWNFWSLFSEHYIDADAVFFHMAPEFVVAAWPFLWSLKKPTALWYTHRVVNPYLKVAEKIVDNIFTASELSFRLPSQKVLVIGHAIDTNYFRPVLEESAKPKGNKTIKLLTLGRISPIKDIETILWASEILKNRWKRPWKLSIVGGPLLPRDHKYLQTLKDFVKEKGLENKVDFIGPVDHTKVAEIYNNHDVFISMSGTGSIDKSVLEAMASGLTVITSNEAFKDALPPQYFLAEKSADILAERIEILAGETCPNLSLRQRVVDKHSLKTTIGKISQNLLKNTHDLAHLQTSKR
ncbi:MAG: glycosyltransferase family 4 protein [bacterium]|nr:glycosyltransferase family 4 protein [bacterium]